MRLHSTVHATGSSLAGSVPCMAFPVSWQLHPASEGASQVPPAGCQAAIAAQQHPYCAGPMSPSDSSRSLQYKSTARALAEGVSEAAQCLLAATALT